MKLVRSQDVKKNRVDNETINSMLKESRHTETEGFLEGSPQGYMEKNTQ